MPISPPTWDETTELAAPSWDETEPISEGPTFKEAVEDIAPPQRLPFSMLVGTGGITGTPEELAAAAPLPELTDFAGWGGLLPGASFTTESGIQVTQPPGIALPMVRTPPGPGVLPKIAAAGAAAYNTIASLPNFLLSPEGAAITAASAFAGPAFAPVAKGVFSGLMAKSAGEQLGTASVTHDPQTLFEGIGAGALGATIPFGKGMFGEPKPITVEPRGETIAAMERRAQEGKVVPTPEPVVPAEPIPEPAKPIEPAPKPLEQMTPKEMIGTRQEADVMSAMKEHLNVAWSAIKEGKPVSGELARSYEILPYIVKSGKRYRYDAATDMFVPSEERMKVSKAAWKTIAGLDALDIRQKSEGQTEAIGNERRRLTSELIKQMGFEPAAPAAPVAEAVPPPPTPTEPAKVKEPWEMTKKEFRKHLVATEGFQATPRDINEQLAQESIHKDYIKQALAQGKPVPAEVLKDYPDLVKPTPVQTAGEKVKKFTNDEAGQIVRDLFEGNFASEGESKVRQEIEQRLTPQQRAKYKNAIASIDRRLEQKATEAERIKRLTTPSTEPVDLGHPAEESITTKEPKPTPSAPPAGAGEVFPPGPGAQTAGEPKYSAVQQLIDQLQAVPPTGTRRTVAMRERLADRWAEGKSIADRMTARLQALTQSLKDTGRGVRSVTDLDRRTGEVDWALQHSEGQSKEAKKTIANQLRNRTEREAVALWIDTPGTPAEKTLTLQQALAQLPEGTPNHIRRAIERAANLTPEGRDLAISLEQYYGIRLQDAQEASIFEEGLPDYFTHIWKRESNMPADLRSALSNGRISTYFKFAQRRKLGMFLDGILQGKVPELDPSDVLPIYNYGLDRAIASREFIRQVSDLTAADGRPALAPAGRSIPVQKEGTPDRLIIKPHARSEELNGYQVVNHPALRKWKWAGTDENGNPVLYQADLLVHPEFYERLSRMMDRGRLTPSKPMRYALAASTNVKGMKLGLLSGFHAVHVGSHALFHWTNPFPAIWKPIDWESPATKFAVEQGHLKLAPDPGELKIVSEGLATGGLAQKIPLIGPWSRIWAEWQFGEFIPRLKLQTFEQAYRRNIWARDNMPGIVTGLKGLTNEEVASRIGDSVNNAFGELNQLFLGKYGRSPEMRRALRTIFLAPDFGEARLRFVGKALTKTGMEERLALATMFLTLYGAARVMNWLSHGDPEMDWKKAFAVKYGDHWWSMRSVVGDLDHLMADFGNFMYVRLNPLYARTATDLLFGRDPSGRKLTMMQRILARPAEQFVPIQLGGLTRDDQKVWESAVTSMGLQTRRDSAAADLRSIISNWKKTSTDPKIKADWERAQQELFAPSPYQPLRNALRLENPDQARKEYEKLLTLYKPSRITEAMRNDRPFTGSTVTEHKFKRSLSPMQRKVYENAVAERRELYQRFLAMRRTLPKK